MCRWIKAQREKTKCLKSNGGKVLDWGLMPPGTVADWPVYAHYFYGEGQYCAGMRDMGELLADVGTTEGASFVAAAKEHQKEIGRALDYASANAPCCSPARRIVGTLPSVGFERPRARGRFLPQHERCLCELLAL